MQVRSISLRAAIAALAIGLFPLAAGADTRSPPPRQEIYRPPADNRPGGSTHRPPTDRDTTPPTQRDRTSSTPTDRSRPGDRSRSTRDDWNRRQGERHRTEQQRIRDMERRLQALHDRWGPLYSQGEVVGRARRLAEENNLLAAIRNAEADAARWRAEIQEWRRLVVPGADNSTADRNIEERRGYLRAHETTIAELNRALARNREFTRGDRDWWDNTPEYATYAQVYEEWRQLSMQIDSLRSTLPPEAQQADMDVLLGPMGGSFLPPDDDD